LVRLTTKHLTLASQPSPKFQDRWIGPLKIVDQVNPVAFRLQLPAAMHRVHPVFHVSMLEKWTTDPANRAQPQRPTPVCEDASTSTMYNVDKILDVRLNAHKNGLQFLVRWPAPWDDPKHDKWEPLRGVNRLRALTLFIRSSRWADFAATAEYKAFAAQYTSRIPSPD
jgi:hypothetical protein